MIVGKGKFEVRGWYAAIVGLWALTGLPLILYIGIGFAGLLGFILWMALNALILAPFLLAPYGIRRTGPDEPR